MNIKNAVTGICVAIGLAINFLAIAQDPNNERIDSLYIEEVENFKTPDKVLHAEPLYIDLIRDLGARKGEKEWNLGLGLTDNLEFDRYEALIEYEFAPINRLGLEIELPFTIYAPVGRNQEVENIPESKMESLKLAAQYSFYVNEKISTSMAIGYINEFEMSSFADFGKPLVTGNVYNPFFIVAKRWGTNFHTLLYTGPRIEQDFESKKRHTAYEINSNVHYMIPGTRNFIGLEINQIAEGHDLKTTIRPQMRVGLAENFLVGIVAGIPLGRENERLSSFVRLIWEPHPHKDH